MFQVVCFKAVTSSARTVAGLTGSGNQRKRGSGPKKSNGDAESGLQDKDSKNSTTLKNGSSKTFLTDVGRHGATAGTGHSNETAAVEDTDSPAVIVPQAIEMASRVSPPQDKIWCHFPAEK